MNDIIDRLSIEDYGRSRKPGTEGGAVDRLLTIQESCELLQVKKSYVYGLTYQKKIPYIKIQGILRFRQSAIDMWLDSQEVRNAS